jgi:ketosteroid isomerase-like protein
MVVVSKGDGPLDVVDRFCRGWESHDLDAILATFSDRPDCIVVGTDADEEWTGKVSFAPAFRAQIDAFGRAVYQWRHGDPRVWATTNQACVYGVLNVSVEIETGSVALAMRSTFALEREDGKWRISHAHFSSPQKQRAVPY